MCKSFHSISSRYPDLEMNLNIYKHFWAILYSSLKKGGGGQIFFITHHKGSDTKIKSKAYTSVASGILEHTKNKYEKKKSKQKTTTTTEVQTKWKNTPKLFIN